MISQLFPFIVNVFTFAIDTFWRLIGAVGSRRIWLYAMYMVLSYRFILRPIFGWNNNFAGSDQASVVYRNSGNGKFSPRNRRSTGGKFLKKG